MGARCSLRLKLFQINRSLPERASYFVQWIAVQWITELPPIRRMHLPAADAGASDFQTTLLIWSHFPLRITIKSARQVLKFVTQFRTQTFARE